MLLFLIIDLYFPISAATTKIFNLIDEVVIHIGIPSKEAKFEIEIHTVISVGKIKKVFNIIYSYSNLFVLSIH